MGNPWPNGLINDDMAFQLDEVLDVLGSNHPAKPYLVLGTIIGGMGLLRNSLSGLLFLGLGGALVARGLEEMKHTKELHGGNHHGTNGPPKSIG